MEGSSFVTTFNNISRADLPVAYNAQLENASTASNDEMLTMVVLMRPLLNSLINPVLLHSLVQYKPHGMHAYLHHRYIRRNVQVDIILNFRGVIIPNPLA